MKEHYVSFECAKRLHELGYYGADKYYVTENFCSGDNPIYFETYSVGDLVDEIVVYFVNENNEDDYRGIPAPRIDQAAKWLREVKGIAVNVIAHDGGKWEFDIVFLPNADDGLEIGNRSPWCRTYEESMDEGITEALEILGKEVSNA